MKRRHCLALAMLPAWAAAAEPPAPATWLAITAEGRQLSWVDAHTGQPRAQLACPHPLSGPPLFSRDGQRALLASEQGWLGMLDVTQARWAAQTQAPAPPRHLSLSADAQWVLLTTPQATTAQLLNAQLQAHKTWPLASRDGKKPSRLAYATCAPSRRSFVLALQDVPELWEISFDPRAEDLYEGLVHDFRMGEGVPLRGFLNPRRTQLAQPLTRLWFEAEHSHVVGVSTTHPTELHIAHLDVRRRIASLTLRGEPDPEHAVSLQHAHTPVLAVPNLSLPQIDLIDTRDWSLMRSIAVPTPAVRLLGHASSPQLWVLPATEDGTLHRLDKTTLALQAVSSPPLRHISASHDGRSLIACTAEPHTHLHVYDTATGTLLRRQPWPGLRSVHAAPGPITPRP